MKKPTTPGPKKTYKKQNSVLKRPSGMPKVVFKELAWLFAEELKSKQADPVEFKSRKKK